ncbi:MAG: multicopper oxidase domain-containing protein [Thiohalomonadales bacterium]
MNSHLIKNTILASAITLTAINGSNAYAEKTIPLIALPSAANTTQNLSVTTLTKTMSDNKAIEFWVFCPSGSGTGMGSMCPGSQLKTLPGPTLTMKAGTTANVTLNMHMAPQEKSGPITDANPYIGHTIHLHGLDMETQFDGVPETFQAEAINNGSSVDLRNGFDYPINSDPNNIRVDDRFVGSHMYHCHVHTVKHLEMGMYGAFVVTSKSNSKLINNSGTTTFDDEWIMMISTVDPAYHTTAAKDDSTIFADYNPRYFLINGEEGNGALINPLLSKTITLTSGQSRNLVIRLMGIHSTNATFSIMSGANKIPFTLYNVDGFALKTPRTVTSVELSPGQTKDVIITLDKAGTYNPQVMFGDLRNNQPYTIIYPAAANRTSIVKTELIVK